MRKLQQCRDIAHRFPINADDDIILAEPGLREGASGRNLHDQHAGFSGKPVRGLLAESDDVANFGSHPIVNAGVALRYGFNLARK